MHLLLHLNDNHYVWPFSWAHTYSPGLTMEKKKKPLTLVWNKHTFSNLCIFKPASHQPLVRFNYHMAVWLPRREIVFILFIFYLRLCLQSFEKAVYLLRKDTWNRPRSLDVEVALTAFLSYFSVLNEWGGSLLRCLPARGALDLLLNCRLKVKRIMDYGKCCLDAQI